jgi:hypothetical protein
MNMAAPKQCAPDTSPMGLARWSATSGYQFCSCGNWHFVRLEPAPKDSDASPLDRQCADGFNGCDDCTDYKA